MPQQEPEKKSAPAAQPIDMPDDEVLYELASTEDGNVSTILDFTVRITLRSAEEADK